MKHLYYELLPLQLVLMQQNCEDAFVLKFCVAVRQFSGPFMKY